MDKKQTKNVLWILFLLAGTIWVLVRNNQQEVPYRQTSGMIFGTIYNITYQHPDDLSQSIDSMLKVFDGSLNPFNKQSVITRINQNEEVKADTLFANVFRRSMEISAETEGAFDITVAPLVNTWGFGFKQNAFPTKEVIDSLLQITGYQKVSFDEARGIVVKEDPRMMLSCSAVAKGYAVDVIGNLLSGFGIKNFMVDIGGEVVVRGQSNRKAPWRIGINKPVEDSLSLNQELQTVMHISNVGIATSGNYRNFYYKDGKKYAHTIDPHTGYPIEHSILSATVIAKDCMSADAYATAFMVMGLEKAEAFVEAHPELDAYFIYSDKDGKLAFFMTSGMKKYLKE